MAEKLLTESVWSAFAKKRELDDGALVKALARLAKADDAKPQAQLDALDEIEAQLKKQRAALARSKAADKDKKELKERLDEMDAALARQRKQALAAGDEEADSPVLMTSRMVPLLRDLRKGELRMPALIATAGKDTAVLIMRRSISPARRKLLTDFLHIGGGAKFYPAECLYENKALTFVLQAQVAGMAKRLRAVLLAQTELRLKVRVRGPEGPAEEDGDEADESSDEEAARLAERGDAPAEPETPAESSTPVDEAERLYQQRLQALMPNLQRAFASRTGDVGKMRAVAEFAREKAAAGNHASALTALGALEKLLAAAAPEPAAATAGARPEGSLAAPELAEWESARAEAVAQLKEIAKEIAAARHADSASALIELQAVIKQLTPKPGTLQQVADLERWLGQDRVVAEVCEFALDIRTPLLGALARLRSAMEATV